MNENTKTMEIQQPPRRRIWFQWNLRTRLFASYVLLLLISLGVLTGVFLVALSSRPAPPQPTWQQLAAKLPPLLSRETLAELRPLVGEGLGALDTFSETNGVRVLLVQPHDESAIIRYDTEGVFQARQEVDDFDFNIMAEGRLADTALGDTQIIFGGFTDPDGSEWLYSGVQIRLQLTRLQRNPQEDAMVVLLAQPPPTTTLQDALADFSSSLLPPLLQAGLIGGVVAFILAFLISRSIARPLQALATATAEVAQGNYAHRVPEHGPREIRAVATAFNQMSTEVRNAQQSQQDFLANVSHDLKTPLTSIQGYSQAIMDGAARDPADAAKIIHDEAARLNRMVVQLTDLARLEAGRLSMKVTAIDVGEMVASIGNRLSVVARKKDIRLHMEAHPMPPIAGDGDQLVQVFTNLISNAIKYTPNGGRVWVTTQVAQHGVQVSVQDTGIGIPAKDLPRIFERFYQVDKARGPKRGTGLGLAITKEIVEAHGGKISVSSPGTNRGATFIVWFPSPTAPTQITRRPRA